MTEKFPQRGLNTFFLTSAFKLSLALTLSHTHALVLLSLFSSFLSLTHTLTHAHTRTHTRTYSLFPFFCELLSIRILRRNSQVVSDVLPPPTTSTTSTTSTWSESRGSMAAAPWLPSSPPINFRLKQMANYGQKMGNL